MKYPLINLFKGYEWNRISGSDRLHLGILFLNNIKIDDKGLFLLRRHLCDSKDIVTYIISKYLHHININFTRNVRLIVH
jgi:hypothetical protein